MIDFKSKIQNLKSKIANGLIVSCQAPADSPLSRPEIIAAFAATAEINGAIGVRIDSPKHIEAVRKAVELPIIGIYKIITEKSEVYITPTFAAAAHIAAAGADLIALDATLRPRPNGERLIEIIARIKNELNLPIMADVSTVAEGVYAAETCGVDFIGTTLSGYTPETTNRIGADFALIEQLAERLSIPVIAEGKLKTPADVQRAFSCGAFSVVVGGAITGTDLLVREFVAATKTKKPKLL